MLLRVADQRFIQTGHGKHGGFGPVGGEGPIFLFHKGGKPQKTPRFMGVMFGGRKFPKKIVGRGIFGAEDFCFFLGCI